MCHTVAIYRSMNGYSGLRQGGSPGGLRAAARRVAGAELDSTPYGVSSPAQRFQFAFTRHMYEYGTTSEQLARVKVTGQQSRIQQPEGLLQAPGDRRRRAGVPVDREAGLPPVGLLRGDRQRHVPHRHVRGPGPRSPAAAGVHNVVRGAGQQALPGACNQCDPITRQGG